MITPIVNSQISNTRESATVAINHQVKELRKANKSVVHFGFGQSPFPVHENIQKALCSNAHEKSYQPTLGLLELRRAICSYLKKETDCDFLPEHTIIGPGSKQLLYQASASLEGPMIMPGPCWVSYGPQAEILGKRIIVINAKRENNYKLQAQNLDDIFTGIDHRQKVMIINSPNNPTGIIYSEAEVKEICEVCRKHNVIILSDEIYGMISFDGKQPASFAKYYPEGTLVTGGLSKGFSAGGYRLGFLAAPPNMGEVIRCLGVITSETYTSVSSPIQFAAVTAFEDSSIQEYAKRCAKIHHFNAQYLFDRFKKAGLNCLMPDGAFYLFPDFDPFSDKLHKKGIRTSRKLAQHLLTECGVAVLPGSDFFWPSDSLACRIASVDFDGAAALKALKTDKYNKDFVEQHCPNLKMGCDRIEAFVQSL